MNSAVKVISIIAFFAAAFTAGFGWRDIARGEAPKVGQIPAAVTGVQPAAAELSPTRVFTQAMERVQNEFYGEPKPKTLLYSGIEGMIASLNDPHTMLLEPDMARQFEEKNQGEFVGIGAELTRDPMGARIRRVFKRSPAEAVGLKANDIITKVNGEDVAGRDLQEVVREIRGETGTYVRLTIFRESVREAINFRVGRKRVEIQDVYGEVLKGSAVEGMPKIGRLEVRSFSETIIVQFDQELDALEDAGIKGLIIDLRGNPGGLLTAAVDMSSRFLDGKLITTMRRRDGRPEVFRSRSGMAEGRRYPVVILVDENSASASEIFAGAMKDWRAATIVGEHTYGKGSVQVVRGLPDGAQVKITIGRYFLPHSDTESIQRMEDENGKYISGGIKPDVEVALERTAIPGDPEKDNQLAKAIDVLRTKLR